MSITIESINSKKINELISESTDLKWNLTTEQLVSESTENGESTTTETGALSCTTGKFTGRSPKDRFIVKDKVSENEVDWGNVNQAISEEHFQKLLSDQLQYIKGLDKPMYARNAYAGADRDNTVTINVYNETAWANLFCKHMFIRPQEVSSKSEIAEPKFTIIHTPNFEANPEVHGTNSETFVVLSLEKGLVIIGGTKYAGEQKKSIFSALNFLYPQKGILPMHCSANTDLDGNKNSSLFFGLSGTGKTTLSADSTRRLIGDDEHGWTDSGVFNFEGGCYAKCIDLTKEKEPEIFDAIKDGAILENVVLKDGKPDYSDSSLTENTRAAYPLEHIPNSVESGVGAHPKNVFFLTCDAFGVMPPISKLDTNQAMYHFLSGYTAKVGGTERGMGDEPIATFSACFGSPFLPLKPMRYAKMLAERLEKHDARCWLVNTGWVGGGYGVGERIKLSYTRAMIKAALDGELDNVDYDRSPVFKLNIPKECPGVPNEVLNPRNNWDNPEKFDESANKLAQRFIDNFQKFISDGPELKEAGPSPL